DTNILYAFPLSPFDVKHENLLVGEKSLKGMTEIGWDVEYIDPPVEFPKDGKFKKPYTFKFLFSDPIQKKVILIEKKFSGFELQEIAIPPSPSNTPAVGTTSAPAT